MVRGREPLNIFRLGSIGNLADSAHEVGGAEVDVQRPALPDVVPPKWSYCENIASAAIEMLGLAQDPESATGQGASRGEGLYPVLQECGPRVTWRACPSCPPTRDKGRDTR